MLIPLWARAEESERRDAIIKDPLAQELVSKIGLDVSVYKKEWMTQLVVAIRTEILDRETRIFIDKHPGAMVINLGCGLDTRFFRVDDGSLRWYDLDLPDAINVRREFFAETGRYRMLARSVFDYSWVSDISRSRESGEPVLIIAEGLLMYFPESQVKELLSVLSTAFPGVEMLLETMSPFMVQESKKPETGRRFQIDVSFEWGVQSGKELEKFNDRIRLVNEWNPLDYHKQRWKTMRWLTMIPTIRNSFGSRIIHITL